MGNQGMTNWKFSAFFAIALLLTVGLFSNTATARDGDGTIEFTSISVPDAGSTTVAPQQTARSQLLIVNKTTLAAALGDITGLNNEDAIKTVRLEADLTVTLVLTYTVATPATSRMGGGELEISWPSGWSWHPDTGGNGAGVVVGEGGVLLTDKTDKNKAVVLLGSAFSGSASTSVTVTLNKLRVPIPARLTDGTNADKYEEYEFTSRSRARAGRFRDLEPYKDDHDDDTTTPMITRANQPVVRVGNIGNGKGKVTIREVKYGSPGSKYAWETYNYYNDAEKPNKFKVVFEAAGPMWNSQVLVTLPLEVDALSRTELTTSFTPSGSLTPTGQSGRLRYLNTGGSEVRLNITAATNNATFNTTNINGTAGRNDGDANSSTNLLNSDPTNTADGTQVLQIDIRKMDKGQGFELLFDSEMLVGIVTFAKDKEATSAFAVSTNSYSRGTDSTGDQFAAITPDGGMLRQKAGSGTMTIDPPHVVIAGSGVKDFTLKYKADTYLNNARLQITVPIELLGKLVDHDNDTDTPEIPSAYLQPIAYNKAGTDDDKRLVEGAGYVSSPDRFALPNALVVRSATDNAAEVDTISWYGLGLRAGQTFRTVIKVDISGTQSQATQTLGQIRDPDDGRAPAWRDIGGPPTTAPNGADGIYPFYTSVSPDFGDPAVLTAVADTQTFIEHTTITGEGADRGTNHDTYDRDADLYALRGQNVDVDFSLITAAGIDTNYGTDDDTAVQFVTYNAASIQNMRFRFRAVNTSLRNGILHFRIPVGWKAPVAPNKDKDPIGELGLIVGGVELTPDQINKGEKGASIKISGHAVQINVDKLPKHVANNVNANGIVITYHRARIQPAAGTADIIGEFQMHKGVTKRRAGRVEVAVTNVHDGTGSATISPYKAINAGSTDNTITVVYKAIGTMNGGQVSLELPDGWGDAQDNDPTMPNYTTVTSSGKLDSNPAYVGKRLIIANLEEIKENDTVTFTYGKMTAGKGGAEAPSDIETNEVRIDSFVIQSKGSRDGILTNLPGPEGSIGPAEPPAPKGQRKLEKDSVPDAKLLTGMVHWIDKDDDKTIDAGETDGKLRVQIVSAADGTGSVAVEVRNSDHYDPNASVKYVHAGDKAVWLLFTYTPTQTITNGKLIFTVPSGWSVPEELPQNNKPGYTYFEEATAAQVGPAVFSGRNVTAEIIRATKGDPINIHYGWYGTGGTDTGANAPLTVGDTAFGIQIQGSSEGSPKPIPSAIVPIYSQASGAGSAAITPTTYHAGDDVDEVTVTYTAKGQIVNGTLRLTIPDKWSPDASDGKTKAKSELFEISAGSATYGGDQTAKPAENFTDDYLRQVVVTGVNMAAAGTFTFKYKGANVQPAVGSPNFTVDFDGNLDKVTYTGIKTDMAKVTDLAVTVGEAKAGSGMAASGQAAVIVDSSENTLTFTYTAIGEINSAREIRVSVPTGWSAPKAAATGEGAYTVMHQDASGVEFEGVNSSVDRTPDANAPRDMVARIKPNQKVVGGHKIVFTYTGTAPATAGTSAFQMSFDGVRLTNNLKPIIVQSAEGVSKLALEGEDSFLIEADDGLELTIKLQDADGNLALMTTPVTVTLTSTSSTGSFSSATVTIAAGEPEGTVTYTDTAISEVTITASATGLDSAIHTVTADTDNLTINAASITVAPAVAKAGTTVTVTANATPLQAVTFSVGAIVTNRSMTESEAGGYSGTFDVVADQHADGVYDVTVKINGTSETKAQALTIDSTAPTVTVSATPATVTNGDPVTITGTVSEAADVTANLSALDTTQTDPFALALSNGSYSGSFTISAENAAMNGSHAIIVTATDAAGNMGTAQAMVTLQNELSYTSTLPAGISLFHVPLDVEGLDTVSDLEAMLGANVKLLITHDGTGYEARSGDVPITADLGIIVSMGAETEVTFEGQPWGNGNSMINLAAGDNLIGLPVNDSRVTNIGDIMSLFDAGVVTLVITLSGGDVGTLMKLVMQAMDLSWAMLPIW